MKLYSIAAETSAVASMIELPTTEGVEGPTGSNQLPSQVARFFVRSAGNASGTMLAVLWDPVNLKRLHAETASCTVTALRDDAAGTGGNYHHTVAWTSSGNDKLDLLGLEALYAGTGASVSGTPKLKWYFSISTIGSMSTTLVGVAVTRAL